MSTRHDISATGRTAGNAGAAASLILGTLLLLSAPEGRLGICAWALGGTAINPKERPHGAFELRRT